MDEIYQGEIIMEKGFLEIISDKDSYINYLLLKIKLLEDRVVELDGICVECSDLIQNTLDTLDNHKRNEYNKD